MKLPPLWKPGLVWLLVLGPLFFLSYGFANHHAASAAVVPSIVFDWERHIPLWPWTILPYWSIDIFYGLSLLICTTRLELRRHGLRLLTAQLLCVACFLLFPLKFSTPRPHVDGWAGQLFDALAGFDLPYNQAPSLHIVLLLILWDFYRQRLHGAWKGVLHVWSALIGVSVLTTFQHHFIDIPTGLLAGSLCLWLWPLDGERPVWEWSVSAQRRRIALYYAVGAFACVLVAGLGRAWWWFYWPAASLTLVALCYAALGEQGFQKRVNGHHSIAARLLFWPYRVGAWLNARAWTLGLPRSAKVGDRDVWLGRLPLPWDGDHHRFDHVVDVTAELGFHHPGARSHGWLDLTEPSPEHLLNAARSVEIAANKGPVLVSCALGFSRSSAVVATWLCVYGHCSTVDEAVALLRQARPQVVLKPILIGVIERAVAEARSTP
ncbi:phosphatase PAP2/dual specificity phosphatase family protein [Rhizobacter sp. Root1221]|uniref:phosphatase PAP2/dual specificity phosphatase family protein n=1 Tax=Rhizobacter sp. Root1221 TaxID=1736433 RepID=UPI000700BA2B|nr:phosphatase PAP2/dual specificity phosphatase family protein [Rhizobacter sp. Root1221]KQV95751.1 hypothetical protein ASC87_04140 [Rhizobacter sp. Root1221]